MKSIDLKKLKVVGAKKFIKGLAFALALSNVVSTTSVSASVNVPITNKTGIEIEHDHYDCDFCVSEHDCECELHEMEEFYASNEKTVTVETLEKKDDSLLSSIDIKGYKGTSIVEALAMNNYDSSFEYRSKLASEAGIKNYQGTAEQNTKLLDILRNNKVEKKDTSKSSKKADSKVEYVKIQDVALYLASLENLTFKTEREAYNWAINNNLLKGNYNYSLNRQDLSNALMNYASFKGVNITAVDYKLDKVINTFTDKKVKMNNINNIARAYYYGYIDVDKNNNANPYSKVTISDVNYGFNNLLKDIQIATINNSKDEKGLLIIKPNVDKYSRDTKDTTLINSIRNYEPVVNKVPQEQSTPSASSTPSEENSKPGTTEDDNKPHHHRYGSEYKVYQAKDSDTHTIYVYKKCVSCSHKELVRKYSENCTPGAYAYNPVSGKEEATCTKCSNTFTKNHNHDYGVWTYYDEDHERKYCKTSGCHDYFEQGHNYGAWADFSETKEVSECSSCGHKKYRNKEDTHTHSYSGPWLNDANDDENCYRICTHAGCDHKEYQAHNYGTTHTQYTKNNDGTHEVLTTHTCSSCGHVEQISCTNENCSYGSINYSADSATTHNVSKTCEHCGYSDSYSESCSFGNYEYNDSTGVDVGHCSHCSNTDERAHSHHYSNWTSISDEECQRICSDCNHPQTQSHSFVDMGDYEQCSDCGYQKQKSHHTHSSATRYENFTNNKDSNCCEKVVYCSDPECGEVISRTPINHDWLLLEDDGFTELYGCTLCGTKKEIDKELPLMMMSMPPIVIVDPILPDPEEVPQDPENQEQLPQDPEDQEQHPENENDQPEQQPEQDPIDEIIDQVINEVIEENNQEQPSESQSESPSESQSEEGPSKTLEL